MLKFRVDRRITAINFKIANWCKVACVSVIYGTASRSRFPVREQILELQARNHDFMWGGANEAKVDQTTEMDF